MLDLSHHHHVCNYYFVSSISHTNCRYVYDMSVYQIQITNFSFLVIAIISWTFLWIVSFDDQAKIFTCFCCVVYIT